MCLQRRRVISISICPLHYLTVVGWNDNFIKMHVVWPLYLSIVCTCMLMFKLYFSDISLCISLIYHYAFLRYITMPFSDISLCLSPIYHNAFLWYITMPFSDISLCLSPIYHYAFRGPMIGKTKYLVCCSAVPCYGMMQFTFFVETYFSMYSQK